jgi:pyruvate/2-oxoglutarate dehydrogenase complex dihydrolipoamide dehydrogenase (E3) component
LDWRLLPQCLPSKNEIWSAKVADLVHHAANFGAMTGSVAIDMAKVRQRKRDMVEGMIALTLQQYKASGAELIMGAGNFVAPKTLEVRLNDGGTRVLVGDQVFLISEHTRPFRAYLASMQPDRLRTSRLWNSTMCRNI